MASGKSQTDLIMQFGWISYNSSIYWKKSTLPVFHESSKGTVNIKGGGNAINNKINTFQLLPFKPLH